jgi:uncharacterized protein (DUF58 family)
MYEMADRPLRVADESHYLHWWRMTRWFANLRLVPRWSSRYEIASKPITRVYRRFFYRPRVSVQRHTPKTAVVGQPLISQISVSNEASHGLYNFSVRELIVPAERWPREWQRPHRMTLAPGQNTTLTASFEPQKRGVLSLSGLAVQSYFPFFLSRHSQRLEDTAEVYVLPPGFKGAALEYAYSRQY